MSRGACTEPAMVTFHLRNLNAELRKGLVKLVGRSRYSSRKCIYSIVLSTRCYKISSSMPEVQCGGARFNQLKASARSNNHGAVLF